MTNEYVCLGGPLDMKTEMAKGHIFYTQSKSSEPVEATEMMNADSFLAPLFNLEQHSYRSFEINLFGVYRTFYIHHSLSQEEAGKRAGLFLASLLDLYVTS